MTCWNGLSTAQQRRLIEVGNLPFGYKPEGTCERGAEVAIETEDDAAPGPRFYCRICAVAFLQRAEAVCRHCGRAIIPTKFGSWQDRDNPGYEVCYLADDDGPVHEPQYP